MESLKRPGADALPKPFHSEAVVATIQTVLSLGLLNEIIHRA